MAYQFDFLSTFDYTDVLVKGVLTTIELIAAGGVIGVAVGIFGAWARTQGPRWLKPLVSAYVELIRNTPFLVQLFFIFFGLPSIGVQITEMQAAILTMVINLGAYSTEIIRASGIAKDLARVIQPDRDRDAGFGGLLADRCGGIVIRSQLHSGT